MAVSLLPNAIMAVIIFIVFLFIAAAAKSLVRRLNHRQQKRQSLGLLLGQLSQVTVVVLGFLISFSVVAPSFQAADLIKVLGVGSVAIGFAFQNILQNFLAGILILLHEPYRLGDSISSNGIEGVVEDIQARATVVSTADGHRAIIPNALLFTNPVVVKSAGDPLPPEPHAGTAPSQQESTDKK
jgi:small-conductance mechanosensitive channel